MIVVVLQRLQNLDGKPSDQVLRHALEVVVLDKLVEIDRKQLKSNNQMLTEEHEILDADHVILVLLIMLIKVE